MDNQRISVLLVEDHQDDARQISAALANAPGAQFDVVHVERLADALQELRQHSPDLVLLDLALADSQGLATFARAQTQAPSVPIVVLSGPEDEELALLAVQVGAQDYLVKGKIDGPLLVRSIRYAIERKRSQLALRVSEERYRSLFEHNDTGVVFASSSFQVLDCNNAFAHLLGFASRDEVLSDSRWVHFFRERHRGEALARVKKERALANVECFLCRKDGSPVWVLGNLSWLESDDGAPVVQGVFIDLSAHKHLEEKFRQSQKMEAVGQLAGGVAHDFNNLLTVIRGFSELMLTALPLGNPMRTYAEEVKNAADRATALTRQLLAFSRKQVLQFRTIDLNAVVAGMSGMVRRLIGEDVEFVCNLGDQLGRVKADPGQMEQVLLNLIVNARDAMPQGGKLTMETANVELEVDHPWIEQGAQPGSYVLLAVGDTGCGMSADILAHLFEPFFTTKEKGQGTGLGLSTVYGIVKQSNGHIDVQSEPRRGTVFRILLPRLEEEVETQKSEPRPAPAGAGRETILLVEDEPLVREVSTLILNRHGYRVLVANSGDEALQVCRDHPNPIPLLVTDVVMPHMSGTELAEKAALLRPDMRVLYLSGYTAQEVSKYGVGETAFLQKPFTSESLSRKVREVLDRPAHALR